MIWSFVLAAVGIAGIYLAGKKSKWGWGLGLGAQILWLIFAIVTAQYGFILTAVAYGAVYGKNLWQWHREESKRGSDGLTDSERLAAARRHREKVAGLFSPSEAEALKKWQENKRKERSTLENCYDEPLGNDGLTDSERREYADRYAAGPGRGLDDKGRESLRRIRERRNDQPKRDQPARE